MFRLHAFLCFILFTFFGVNESFLLAQSTDKLQKEANALFKSENYIEATPKYLQLLSLEPRNSFFNYRYGACLLFNSEKKPDALKYLKFAVTDSEVDPEAHYYLARALHLNYYFDKAIRSYQVYKGLVKDKTALKRDVDRQIEMCKNGQRLMTKVSDLIVKERKNSAYDDFFRLYNLRDIGGSILVTEDFQSKVDKKRGHKPTIHFAEDKDAIFYSSYGETDEGQKDIYYRIKNEGGTWGEPIKAPNTVNTQFDEDFPYLDPNGRYLYFSSKGHNSMGGYDVFRVSIQLDEMKFGRVENLDFAISSPDDDLFYVVDKEYKHAYFASTRQSEGGKIHVYRVMVNKFESNMLLIAGDFVSMTNSQSKNVTIQIKEVSTGKIIDQVKSNPTTGEISLSLPRAGKYEFIVKTENLKSPQTIAYEAPLFDESKLIKLNFIEESSGGVVSVKVSQEDYYQFTEDERADALASLFLSKSELQPNVQLLDLLEQPSTTTAPPSSSEIAKKYGLEKYSPQNLSEIATKDVEKLKESFKKNEDQKKVFLHLASDNIDKAQKIEALLDQYFEKAEKSGLSNVEIENLKKLDQQRTQLLFNAGAATKIANNLQQNSNYIQADIAKADEIRQKMASVKTENDLTFLEELTDVQKTYVKERFNKSDDFEIDKHLNIGKAAGRLQQIEASLDEFEKVKVEIDQTEDDLAASKVDLSNAKKKDREKIEQKINELESTLEALQRQERFLARQNEKLKTERDSISALTDLHAQSKQINPNEVSPTNNTRLLEAKLKTENAKNVNQKTQNVVETVQVNNDTTNQLSDNAITINNSSTNSSTTSEKQHEQIQQLAASIYEIEKKINQTPENEYQKRLTLQKEKKGLLENQIELLEKMKVSEPSDALNSEIETQNLQLAIVENQLAELSDLLTQTTNESSNQSSESVGRENSEPQLEKVNSDLANMKSSYNIDSNLNNLDITDSDNLRRIQRYESALVDMLSDKKYDEVSKKQINQELENVRTWLDKFDSQYSTNVVSNKTLSPNNATNESSGIKTSTVYFNPENYEAAELVDKIATIKADNQKLIAELDSVETNRQERKILKQIGKNEKEISNSQYNLILSEKDDYAAALEDVKSSIAKNFRNDPLLKSEFLILSQKLNELNDVIDVMKDADRFDRERILIQAQDIRLDFMKQYEQLLRQLEAQQEIARVSQKSGLPAEFLSDAKKMDYALANINEDIDESNERISFFERNLSSYSKSEQPKIQQDIDELRVHVEQMEKLKKDTQNKVQDRKKVNAIVQIPKLDNSQTDLNVLESFSEAQIREVLNDIEFLNIRNNLVTFKTLDIRMQNASSQQKSMGHSMQSLINEIAVLSDESAKDKLRKEIDDLATQFRSNETEINEMNAEMTRLKDEIQSNEKYAKNPVLFNTLANSTKIQETILTSVNQTNASASVQSSGITFVNPENRGTPSENFALNPVQIPGLVYKIQIGSFNRPVDISSFSEFDPVTTDQIGNSIRYSAGLFYNKNQAFSSLNPIKAMGYRDAFVVAYCDGVRYSVAEADELLRQGKCALNNSEQLAMNITTSKNTNYNKGANAAPALALEEANGLLFTVQIGVYNTPRTHESLQNLDPLNTQLTERNQIRYSVGRFDQVQDAVRKRDEVKNLGFPDAFIVAYYNGEKVSVAEAQSILAEKGEMALYNKQSNGRNSIDFASLSFDSSENAVEEKIEILSKYPIKYRYVSTKTYTKAPHDVIKNSREKNVWTYFDEQIGRLISAEVSENSSASIDEFVLKPFYQGFVVADTSMVTYQNLENFQSETSYYSLTMTWDDDLPALVAYMLQQNFSFSIADWNPEDHKISFQPLNYAQKEKIRKSILPLGGVSFVESVLTF